MILPQNQINYTIDTLEPEEGRDSIFNGIKCSMKAGVVSLVYGVDTDDDFIELQNLITGNYYRMGQLKGEIRTSPYKYNSSLFRDASVFIKYPLTDTPDNTLWYLASVFLKLRSPTNFLSEDSISELFENYSITGYADDTYLNVSTIVKLLFELVKIELLRIPLIFINLESMHLSLEENMEILLHLENLASLGHTVVMFDSVENSQALDFSEHLILYRHGYIIYNDRIESAQVSLEENLCESISTTIKIEEDDNIVNPSVTSELENLKFITPENAKLMYEKINIVSDDPKYDSYQNMVSKQLSTFKYWLTENFTVKFFICDMIFYEIFMVIILLLYTLFVSSSTAKEIFSSGGKFSQLKEDVILNEIGTSDLIKNNFKVFKKLHFPDIPIAKFIKVTYFIDQLFFVLLLRFIILHTRTISFQTTHSISFINQYKQKVFRLIHFFEAFMVFQVINFLKEGLLDYLLIEYFYKVEVGTICRLLLLHFYFFISVDIISFLSTMLTEVVFGEKFDFFSLLLVNFYILVQFSYLLLYYFNFSKNMFVLKIIYKIAEVAYNLLFGEYNSYFLLIPLAVIFIPVAAMVFLFN